MIPAMLGVLIALGIVVLGLLALYLAIWPLTLIGWLVLTIAGWIADKIEAHNGHRD